VEKKFPFFPISYYYDLEIWKRLFGKVIPEAGQEVNFHAGQLRTV
jgi:hypothetical protein